MKYVAVMLLVTATGCTTITIQSSTGKGESGQENVTGLKVNPKINNDTATTREVERKEK